MPRGYPDYTYFQFPLGVAAGGTGTISLTQHGVLIGNGQSTINVTAAGNPLDVLQVPAGGGDPAFAALSIDAGVIGSGILPIVHGGTGTATGSITGTGSLTFSSTGANSNVSLAPGASGYSLLGGMVGIGTAAPTNLLNVVGTASGGSETVFLMQTAAQYGNFCIENTAGLQAALVISQATGGAFGIGMDFAGDGSQDFYIYQFGVSGNPFFIGEGGEVRLGGASGYAGTQAVTIQSGGNVGIGATSPTHTLEVGGTLQVSGAVTLQTALPVTGGGTGQGACSAGQLLIGSGTNTAAWGTPDGCAVYNSAAESILDNTWISLTFDTERYNNGGMHSTVTHSERITAQKAGVYVITGHAEFTTTGSDSRGLRIRLNGATTIAEVDWQATSVTDGAKSIARVYHLAVSDYVTLDIFQNKGLAINCSSDPNFSPEFAAQWLGP